MRFVYNLPDDWDSVYDEMSYIKRLAMSHFAENRGECPLFGKITGYVYVQSYDRYLRLDIYGELRERIYEHFNIPFRPSLKIGGKSVALGVGGVFGLAPQE